MIPGDPLPDRLSDRQQTAVARVELDDDRIAEAGVRNAIAKDHPARAIASFATRSVRHVDDVIPLVTSRGKGAQGENRRVVAQDPVVPARRILHPSQTEEERRAHRDPRRVEQPETPSHAAYHSHPMTRDEIERKLIEIVRREKDIPAENLALATPLAEAGIDSLDALTILFAIEEEFHISIPDDQARAIATFGDMVDVVVRLT